MASGSDDGRLFIWEKQTGRLIKMLLGDEAGNLLSLFDYVRAFVEMLLCLHCFDLFFISFHSCELCAVSSIRLCCGNQWD